MTQILTRPMSVAGAFVCALIIQTNVAHAQQPVIGAVSGSTTQGALVTISGSSLNAERLQNLDTWFVRNPTAWSFEGPDPQSDGYMNPGGAGNGVYDTSVKLLGNKSIKFHSIVNNPSCMTTGGVGQSYNYLALDDASSDNDIWVRGYVRWNRITNWPSYYMKMMYGFNEAYYFQPTPAAAGSNPANFDAAHSGISHVVSNPTGGIQNNRWYAVEVHWTRSPGVFEAWVDGVQVYSGTTAKAGNGGLKTFLFGIINGCGAASWDIEHWVDGLIIGHQRMYPSAIVEVGDNSNYSTAKRRIQAVESISDNQITFRLDTTGLGAGPYYVWVRNNAQSLSPAYFLTGGQISGPVAPTNLRIVP